MESKKNPLQSQEGAVAKAIEEQTAQLPSDTFEWTALAIMGLSLGLKCLGMKHTSLFIGQYMAPFLLFGVYNKIVKTQGHSQSERTVAPH